MINLYKFFLLFLFLSSLSWCQSRTVLFDAERDSRGEPELVVCSQNLQNHGTFKESKKRFVKLTSKRFIAKRKALVERFDKASCDIIAFQEAIGRPSKGLERGMDALVVALKNKVKRHYKYVLGDGTDRYSRVGYLYDINRVSLLTVSSARAVELPRLLPKEKPKFFSRAPLLVEFMAKGKKPRKLVLTNLHLKSKANSQGDPAALGWETTRMQMTEAVRRILIKRYRKSFVEGNPLLIVLGDRNSDFNSASATILEGRLKLKDFMKDGICRLSKNGVPLCKETPKTPQILFSVLTKDPQTKLLSGTHNYKGEFSWLDDILMPQPALKAAWESSAREGDYAVGVISEPKAASDHALIWVKLNW